jgi:hypothetical protein
MMVDEAVKLLERLLAEAPGDPAGVWDAFRQWACQPVACAREELEASIGHEKGTAWIEFRRVFEDPAAEQDEWVLLRFSSSRPDAPRLAAVGEWCDERKDLAEFFARVQALPGFTLALAYPHWQFEAERG